MPRSLSIDFSWRFKLYNDRLLNNNWRNFKKKNVAETSMREENVQQLLCESMSNSREENVVFSSMDFLHATTNDNNSYVVRSRWEKKNVFKEKTISSVLLTCNRYLCVHVTNEQLICPVVETHIIRCIWFYFSSLNAWKIKKRESKHFWMNEREMLHNWQLSSLKRFLINYL